MWVSFHVLGLQNSTEWFYIANKHTLTVQDMCSIIEKGVSSCLCIPSVGEDSACQRWRSSLSCRSGWWTLVVCLGRESRDHGRCWSRAWLQPLQPPQTEPASCPLSQPEQAPPTRYSYTHTSATYTHQLGSFLRWFKLIDIYRDMTWVWVYDVIVFTPIKIEKSNKLRYWSITVSPLLYSSYQKKRFLTSRAVKVLWVACSHVNYSSNHVRHRRPF